MKNYDRPRQELRALGWSRHDRSHGVSRGKRCINVHLERWQQPGESDGWSWHSFTFAQACRLAGVDD